MAAETWTTGGILVRQNGAAWRQPTSTGYLNEAELRDMLRQQPSLIPGIGPGAVAVTEFQSGIGPTDMCVVDGDGAITLVECKLASNPEIRRKIIGQVLDYAARLWRMEIEEFDSRWRSRADGRSVLESLAEDNDSVDALQENLREGRFTLVLAVDLINEDLRRIVEYLNTHTSEGVQVFAIELTKAWHADVEILLPRVFGLEIAAAKAANAAKAGNPSKWLPEDVVTFIEQEHPSLTQPVRQFLADAERDGLTPRGTAATSPSLILRMELPGGPVWPYAIYTGAKPRIQMNFHWLTSAAPTAREAFLDSLASRGFVVDAQAVRAGSFKAHPSMALERLSAAADRAALLDSARLLRAGGAHDDLVEAAD